jgi:poly(A) polymerase
MTPYDVATSIIIKLQNHGFTAYFTGGWVRDFLMDHPSDDIDIATDAPIETIQALFPKTIPVGIQFGILIVVEQQMHFEVATFRKEEQYKDGRRPTKIEKATPQEDASRRDFTINGMFYDPIDRKVIDYVEGKKDLELKLIRAIGNPHERFLEDRLRMIRAARYATRLHFTLESETKQAIIAHAKDLFPSVAIERIWQEFAKMKKFGSFKSFLILLHELSLLQVIFKETKDMTFQQLQKLLSPLDFFPKQAPLIAKLMLLFPSYDLEKKLMFCDRFKLSNEERQFITYLDKVIKLILSEEKERYILVTTYASGPFQVCLEIATAHLEKQKRHDICHFHEKKMLKFAKAIERIVTKTPLISSEILLQHGIKPGKIMGVLLKEAEKLAINYHSEHPEEILALLKNSSLWPKEL